MFGKRKKRREAIRNKLREKSEYKMKSENVAIPEIHTKDFDEIEEHIDEIEQEKEEKYKAELLIAAKKAEAANEAKTEFLQRMSHDIRTPINGICGLVNMADHCADDTEKQKMAVHSSSSG